MNFEMQCCDLTDRDGPARPSSGVTREALLRRLNGNDLPVQELNGTMDEAQR
jgi:hypothetical protein